MSTDAKKHTTIAPGENPNRAALAAAILSINDVVPVANATEAAQIAATLEAAGQNFATAPLTVSRADAPALHRIETTYDGDSWMPASGVLHFANDGARDAWTTSFASFLSAGDTCVSAGVDYRWNGTAWVAAIGVMSVKRGATQSLPNGAYTDVLFTGETPVLVGTGISIAVSTGIATITQPGIYRIFGSVTFAGGGTIGTLALGISLNGATTPGILAGATANTAQTLTIEEPAMVLAANDTVKLRAIHNSGAAKNIGTAPYSTLLSITRLAG